VKRGERERERERGKNEREKKTSFSERIVVTKKH
jgi:hypothetical protein